MNFVEGSEKLQDNEKNSRLPDFVIVGAQKSGTSTLRNILSRHENIFVAKSETHFFDIDDIEQHHDFFIKLRDGWTFHDFESDFEKYFSWWQKIFLDQAEDEELLGDYSTTYMASRKAPGRIKELIPEAKLIFLLRDPVSRCYSHYWHKVRSGRAVHDFENTLQLDRAGPQLLERSFYKRHIIRYLNYFRRDQCKFVIFEEFINNMHEKVDEICEFLNVSKGLDVTTFKTHINPSKYPKIKSLQLLLNRIMKGWILKKYLGTRPNMREDSSFLSRRVLPLAWGGIKLLNMRTTKPKPKMDEKTRSFLEKLMKKENDGLSEILDRDLTQYWPWMSSN